MSLYNIVHGLNVSCFYILPMLGRKMKEYSRFRDCFVTDDNNIAIYTRVGGGNRGAGFGEEELYKDPNFIKTYDDEFDDTYGTYEFKVPDEWKKDFDSIIDGRLEDVSDEYVERIREFYPELSEEVNIDLLFKRGCK